MKHVVQMTRLQWEKHLEQQRGEPPVAGSATGSVMESAFRGYAAIPERTGGACWWETLGVPVNASKEQAKEAFRLLAKKHHPDTGGEPEMFQRINEAWRMCENQTAR